MSLGICMSIDVGASYRARARQPSGKTSSSCLYRTDQARLLESERDEDRRNGRACSLFNEVHSEPPDLVGDESFVRRPKPQ